MTPDTGPSPDEQARWQSRHVCWIGSARYTRPLDSTSAAKWSRMAALGVQMSVVAFSNNLAPRRFDQFAHFYLMPQLPVAVLRYGVIFLIAPWLALWVVLARGADIVVTQSPFDGAVGALIKQIAGLFGRQVVLIVENHGDFEESVFMQRRVLLPGLYRWLMRRLASYAFRHADLLRSISSMTEAQIKTWRHGQPIVRFMTWTDAGAFTTTQRPQSLPASVDVTYAGVLIPRKGVHFLLDAFARIAEDVPNAQLWLVGNAENDAYAAELADQVARLGLSERVTFVGDVSQSELAAYLARSRVSVLPSVSEGLGRVVVESMMVGTPVIGSRVGGIPDMIEDGVNGYLVPPEDVAALADALRQVYDDTNIEQMGQAARQFADDFFSPAGYIDGYRRLIVMADRILRGEAADD